MNDFDDTYLITAAQVIRQTAEELRADNEAAARRELRERLQVLTAWRDEAQSCGRVKEYALTTSLIIEYRWRLNAAPVELPASQSETDRITISVQYPQVAAPEELNQRLAKEQIFLKAFAEAQGYKGDTDPIELLILKMAGFDFDAARTVIRTVRMRLQSRYELDMHEQYDDLDRLFTKLYFALSSAEEPEPDPRHDEDAYLDDQHKW